MFYYVLLLLATILTLTPGVYAESSGSSDHDHDHSTFITAIIILGVIALAAIIGLIVIAVRWNRQQARISDQAYIARDVMKTQMNMNKLPAVATAGRRKRELALNKTTRVRS